MALNDNKNLAALIKGISQGQRNSFNDLYSIMSPKLFALILRITKEESKAEDILQEVFIKLWQNAKTYDPAKAQATTWLYTIARNRALDHLRTDRGNRHQSFEEELVAGLYDEPNPQQLAEHALLGQYLSRCLNLLNENQKKSIQFAYLEGLTHFEVSSKLAKPLGTIKSWLRRGLQNLSTCVERACKVPS